MHVGPGAHAGCWPNMLALHGYRWGALQATHLAIANKNEKAAHQEAADEQHQRPS